MWLLLLVLLISVSRIRLVDRARRARAIDPLLGGCVHSSSVACSLVDVVHFEDGNLGQVPDVFLCDDLLAYPLLLVVEVGLTYSNRTQLSLMTLSQDAMKSGNNLPKTIFLFWGPGWLATLRGEENCVDTMTWLLAACVGDCTPSTGCCRLYIIW